MNTSSAQSSIQTLTDFIINVINYQLIPVLFAVMFITFLWGVYQYFIAGGANEEKQKQGRQFVIWSVVGFAIIFSLWGFVNLITTSLPFDNNQPDIPTLNVNGSTNGNTATSPVVNQTKYTGTVNTP